MALTGVLAGSAGLATAGDPIGLPVVSIEATRRIAEEDAAPLRRINLVGEFTVSRTGPTDFSLPVWIHVGGSATPRVDYEALPWLVTIPEGERSVSFPVMAFKDEIPEGIETVVAEVSNCPPETEPPLGAPCYGFAIDPLQSRDTVFIREDGLTTATVHIKRPENGDRFPVGAPIGIRAVAIDLDSYISRVEFWANGTQIGVSEIFFIVAPPPGSPIHHEFVWTDAPPGDHVLTARAARLDGTRIASTPVRISVGPRDENVPPVVEITSPADGEAFPAGGPVPVEILTRDPDGYVTRMELFADGMKIGEQNIAFFEEPPPNLPQTFTFTWEDPPPGVHVLRARATDNRNASAVSEPVTIVVGRDELLPTVKVVARDAFAVEPGSGGPVNTATFVILRFGAVDRDLTVRYTLGGRAENGVDYEELSGTAVIPAGSPGVPVVVTPLADGEDEGIEPVKLRLDEDPGYRLATRRRAVALISDRPWSHPRGGPHCRKLPDGLVHFCFPAPDGELCRLEGSGNLRDWATILRLPAIDGAVHYVGETGWGPWEKFCRIAPEN